MPSESSAASEQTSEEPLGAPERPLSGPQWLHPLSPIFDLLSHVRSLIVPILLAAFGAARDEIVWQLIAAAFLVMGLFFQLIHYFTFRFWLTESDLVSRQGLVFHKTRTIPLNKIQNIDVVQNVLHRMFGVAEGRIETASGTEVEAVLRVLSVAKLERLREAVAQRNASRQRPARAAPAAMLESVASPGETIAPGRENESSTGWSIPQPVELLRISPAQLSAAGLANNRGLVLVGVVIGGLYQFDVLRQPWIKFIWDFLPTHDHSMAASLRFLVGLAALVVLLRVLSVAWYVTRFYDYRLVLDGDDLRVSCGLITRVNTTIPRRRVQFVSIQQNWLMRYFHQVAIRVETAGGAAVSEENAHSTLLRKWFIPVLPNSDVARIVNVLRPGTEFDVASFDWQPVSARTRARLMRLAVVYSMVGLGVLAFLCWQWGTWWPMAGVAMIAPYLLWLADKKSRSLSLARTDWGVVYRSGVWLRKTSLTFFDRIQVVTWQESPFDRRWQMAGIAIDTAGSGPADHSIDVHYLDASVARREFEAIQSATAARRLQWA